MKPYSISVLIYENSAIGFRLVISVGSIECRVSIVKKIYRDSSPRDSGEHG